MIKNCASDVHTFSDYVYLDSRARVQGIAYHVWKHSSTIIIYFDKTSDDSETKRIVIVIYK